jgi:hypothetical protein
VDEPQSIEDLMAPDEMTRHFNWWGLSGALLPPEDSLRYLHDSINRARLVGAVPQDVRKNFERVRKTFLYGLMDYDLFTVADDDARLILEGALRDRFVAYYDGEITIIRGEQERTLRGSSFDEIYKRRKHGDLLVTRDGKHRGMPSGMSGLLAWARWEGLLTGQRSARSDKAMSRLRNYVAHPSGFHLLSPPDAARTLSRVAEFINKLWGVDTPGGQVFPAPIERIPRVVVLASDGRCVTFTSVRQVREVDPTLADGTFSVYLATPYEELCEIGRELSFRHRPGFQWTDSPCDLLWGPGPRSDLTAQLDRFETDTLNDQVQCLDRLFIIRVDGDEIDDPRSPSDFEACDLTQGSWHVIRADHPYDALRHVRAHRGMPVSELKDGYCPDCPVTELGRFESREQAVHGVELLGRCAGR